METIATLKTEDLHRLLKRTEYAMCADHTRVSHGLFLETAPGAVRVVATDGHRHVVSSSSVTDVRQASLRLAPEGVAALRRNLGDRRDLVDLVLDGSGLIVYEGIVRHGIYARTVPPSGGVTGVHPTGHVRATQKNLRGLLRALNPAAGTTIVFELETRSMLRLSRPDQEYIFVPLESSTPFAPVGFRASYLKDLLDAQSDADLTLEFGGPLDPMRLVTDEGQTTSLVMPVRL